MLKKINYTSFNLVLSETIVNTILISLLFLFLANNLIVYGYIVYISFLVFRFSFMLITKDPFKEIKLSIIVSFTILLLLTLSLIAVNYIPKDLYKIYSSLISLLFLAKLMRILLNHSREKGWLKVFIEFYVNFFEAFIYLMFITGLVHLIDEMDIPYEEEYIIISIIGGAVMCVSIFLIRMIISISHMDINVNTAKLRTSISIITLILWIVIPDVIYGGFIYPLVLSAFIKFDLSTEMMIYYSLSNHFLIPKSTDLLSFEEAIKNEWIGRIAFVGHMITVRLVDITIIAKFSTLFLNWNHQKSS